MSHPLLPQRSLASSRLPPVLAALARVRAAEPALFWAALAQAAAVPFLLAMMPFDGRTILGVDPWLKPVKFLASVSIYTITIAFLVLPLADGRAKAFVRWATIVPLALENVIITARSARGVTSHFNDATPTDAILFGIMGVAILVVTASMTALLALHLRSRALHPTIRWGVLAGIAVSLVGSAVGGAMVSNEGHAVGGAEDAEGLPIVNWSREGGDLRIAHFAGLHALQALPLVGLAAQRSRRGVAVVAIASALYAGSVVGLYVLAILGRPLIG